MALNLNYWLLNIACIIYGIYGDTECPNNTSYPTTICPIGSTCCQAQYSNNAYGCSMSIIDNPSQTYCCLPGPELNASSTLPNVMILGDSVSIGYTPDIIKNLSSQALVQHSPWDTRNGGAQSTSYGLSCLPIFLKNIKQEFIDWDLIQFNFGLHDLDNSTQGEQTYKEQLQQITEKLVQFNNGSAKLQYALTTPFMPDYNGGNYAVEEDNKIATEIMNNYSIPIVDLYQTVVGVCGPLPYVNCSICRVEPCSYHYNTQGYQDISVPINIEIRKNLGLSMTVNV